jgi:hypothetical protein
MNRKDDTYSINSIEFYSCVGKQRPHDYSKAVIRSFVEWSSASL